MFALVDCNNFFCSCERVFNPSLINKPIVVLSNNDGCIISRSQEAKNLHIPMAVPYHHYKKIIDKNMVYVFSSNYELYGDMSRRVMKSLEYFIEKEIIDIYSIDEAFLKIPTNKDHYLQIIKNISKKIPMWTGIPISIGIGPTKTLAKIANSIAKKSKTNIFDINDNNIKQKILETLNVLLIWGIGIKSS